MTQSIFRNVNQALHMAYLMHVLPVTQKGTTQTMIEHMVRQAGLRTEDYIDSTIDFSGLSPLEVRGQCALIRGAVDHHCTPIERAAIVAYYALDSTKAEGVRVLRQHVSPLLNMDNPSLEMLIVWCVHAQGAAREQCTERAIAGEYGMSQSTVHRAINTVRAEARRLRLQGQDALMPMFERDELVLG